MGRDLRDYLPMTVLDEHFISLSKVNRREFLNMIFRTEVLV